MAVTYGFFNSVLVNGMQDRRYNADQMSTYFKGLISDGVYQNVGGGLQVRAGEGMTVQVMPGRGVFDSRWLENDSVLDIPLDSSHVTLNRYTAVVVRVDYNERTVSILAKDGETASAPVKPIMTRSESVKEYCLAYVYVGRGVTSISQSAVTDTRPDNALCGFVTGLVEQIQTTDLFAQYDAAFDEWFETIEGKLSGDVAGKLTVDVERLEREKQDTISGTKGQIVGFDDDGTPVAQEPSDTGVTSFKGRKGAVMPRAGDYSAVDVGAVPTTRKVSGKALSSDISLTAADVGALAATGGTVDGSINVTGNLTLKGNGSYGNKINLGDGDYVHISEPTDDCMEIKAKKVNFVISSAGADGVAINGKPLVGKSLVGKSVQVTQGTSVIAGEGAEIFNDYVSRSFDNYGQANAGNIASGLYSHAEGRYTTSIDLASHAEGIRTISADEGTHAEGYQSVAKGKGSHSEGNGCVAASFYGSHAEGRGCIAAGVNAFTTVLDYNASDKCFICDSSYIFQYLNIGDNIAVIDGSKSFNNSLFVCTVSAKDEPNLRITVEEDLPSNGFTPIYLVNISGSLTGGDCAHAEGKNTKAVGLAAHSEGIDTEVAFNAEAGHAEGSSSRTLGKWAHAEGLRSTAVGSASHAEGCDTMAKGAYSHAEGNVTRTNGQYSHAEGNSTIAEGTYSHASGVGTSANATGQFVVGWYNVINSSNSNLFIVGKGQNASSRANCLRVTQTGVYASGSYSASGADYAEFFEWLDANPEAEDRVGLFVTLVGEKIEIASFDSDFILGIVSAIPSVCGDVYDDQWKGMYLYDIYGRPLWEDVEVPDETVEEPDPENPGRTITRVIIPAHTEHRQKLNPDYDNTQPYVPRSERPEWDAVGMLGKLVVRDDGTCRVNECCAVGENGTATYSGTRTKYRVMARLDENHVRVLIL